MQLAQFDSVPTEDFSQFVASWETFVNEVDERSSYIFLNVFIEWGIKPYYVSPVSTLVWWSLRCRIKLQVIRIPALANASWYRSAASLNASSSGKFQIAFC